MGFKEIYLKACADFDTRVEDNEELTAFIISVNRALDSNAQKGYRIYGRDTAVDEVYILAKALNVEEGLLWGYLIRYFDEGGVEIQQTQFSVIFKIKGCV